MYTRRELGKLALTALPAATLLRSGAFAQAKPNSKVRGVMIGMNVPYNFGGRSAPVDEIIDKCVQLGVSGLELRTQPVEAFLGLPDALVTRSRAGRRPQRQAVDARAGRRAEDRRRRDPQVAAWPPRWTRRKALRKKFEDAGILVEIVKVDNILSHAGRGRRLRVHAGEGARGAGDFHRDHARRSESAGSPLPEKRLGTFADKHKLMVGYHGHAETGPKEWKEVFSYARHNGANLDIGHFIVGNKTSPVPFLKEHHDRITHIHVKDRTLDGRNVPVRHGRHADQGSAAADSRQQVADPGHHRVRIPGSGRLRSDDGAEEVRGLLPGGAGVSVGASAVS